MLPASMRGARMRLAWSYLEVMAMKQTIRVSLRM